MQLHVMLFLPVCPYVNFILHNISAFVKVFIICHFAIADVKYCTLYRYTGSIFYGTRGWKSDVLTRNRRLLEFLETRPFSEGLQYS